MAQNKIAFTLSEALLGPEATELNPSVKVGTMPVPSIHEGDKQSWIGGERFTVGCLEKLQTFKRSKTIHRFSRKA
ncbi:hypothetical protein ACEQPO_15320 [Bacillus sp. SL00103]